MNNSGRRASARCHLAQVIDHPHACGQVALCYAWVERAFCFPEGVIEEGHVVPGLRVQRLDGVVGSGNMGYIMPGEALLEYLMPSQGIVKYKDTGHAGIIPAERQAASSSAGMMIVGLGQCEGHCRIEACRAMACWPIASMGTPWTLRLAAMVTPSSIWMMLTLDP